MVLAGVLPRAARADTAAWPSRTVRLINPFPPGGPSDLLARAVAPMLQARFGQAFIVENKAGAAGNIGAETVARSSPDGLTLFFGIDTTLTINTHLYKSIPFTAADFVPVIEFASTGLMLAVSRQSGIKSMKDLLEAGKRKELNFSSAGAGSPGHLAAQMLSETAGLKINHVPYKGNSPAVTAVVSGEVDGGLLAIAGLAPFLKDGRVTGLAVTSAQRSKLAPDLPTVAELGMKSLTQEVLYVVMAPAGTPAPIVKTLADALQVDFQRPELQKQLALFDMHYEGLTGQAAAERLSAASERYARVIKSIGLSVD